MNEAKRKKWIIVLAIATPTLLFLSFIYDSAILLLLALASGSTCTRLWLFAYIDRIGDGQCSSPDSYQHPQNWPKGRINAPDGTSD